MFKRILVPIDGSVGAERALLKAVELQKLCGAEIIILTVFRHHSLLEDSLSMVRPTEPESIDDAQRRYAREIAEHAKAVATEAGAGAIRAFVKNGQPARAIIAFAKEHEADLIVLGSRGLGSVEGYLLGSVSHKVTALSDTPVLVI
ncbi:universal stress protein [Pikeienuella piscinae]|uniref:Universal stress protein n=1 Tax=Pikeienuella piscinae TaxID=2748098 RepID=A0A7L5BUV3_9RHOB|nr:universal stress protein [Pikeienuella piscinae]QIE55462.1 universal stress protein [Pikeienuella piscinae]